MFFSDDKLVDVLLTFNFLLFQFFRDFLLNSTDPGFGLFVQDAQLGVEIQIFNIGRIDNCTVNPQISSNQDN